jgi:phosphoesterase RecJ-like protein
MQKSLKEKFKKTDKEIKKAKNILLVSHRAPDGDAIGALLALNYYLKKKNKKTYIFSSGAPKYLNFLEEYKEIQKKSPPSNDFDLIFALDYADDRRIDVPPNFSLDEKKVISIDHHASGKTIGKIKIVSGPASSVCEMIYYFFKLVGQKIDKTIATYLLVGVFTDTVGFTRMSDKKEVRKVIVDLLEKGGDIAKVTSTYSQMSLLQARVLERLLSRIKWDKKLGLIYSWISYLDFSELRKLIYKKKKRSELFLQEPPVFPDFLSRIGEAEVYVFLVKLRKEKIKVSLRSSGEFDVAKFSERFGGGGHKEAAGFFIKGTVKEAVNLVKKELKKQKK